MAPRKTSSKKKPASTDAGSIIDHSQYTPIEYVDPKTGRRRKSLGCGDAVALAMLGLEEKDIDACARKNKLGAEVADREFPNLGMKRMSLGNRLRAMVRNGAPVHIGPHEVKKLDQRVALPEAGEAVAPKAKKEAKAPKAAKRRGKKAGDAQEEAAEAAE